ncbi:ATP-binding cassette domain-containing protein [Peptococcus simiae]|uniref:ATP-binding cassette domain-containing protein n=1 Tax=Peptococcus simiae TaxID=1643805 RepID=A0ABW9GZX0_9FIRM
MFELRGVQFKGILHIPDLEIEEGAVTSIVGSSGSGKTTLLRMLNKMISPDRGTIYWQSRDLADLDAVDLRRQVVMLGQRPVIFPGTVADNLQLGRQLADQASAEEGALRQVLAQVALDKALEESAKDLSGGEGQRLALGRILLMDPAVYLLDEPSSALDEQTAVEVIGALVRQVRAKGKTLVMVTHAPAIAESYSDRIISLEHGRVKACRELAHG